MYGKKICKKKNIVERKICIYFYIIAFGRIIVMVCMYEGWNFNSGKYLFTNDTK